MSNFEAAKHRIRMACIWSWVPCIVVFGISFGLIAGFLPPTGESWSAQRVAEFYAEDRTAIRIGLIGAMFGSALLLPFFTVVSREMRAIEGRDALLAPIQFGGAVVLVTFFQIICLLWLLASFRPEADAGLIRAATDYGWLTWTILIPTYMLQFIAMAIAGFIDPRPQPLWPRWAAYMNLWVATLGAGGICAVFFKTGPFSWNGIIGWWMPTLVFAVGMTVNMWLLHRYAKMTACATAPAFPSSAASSFSPMVGSRPS
ncbi:MAG TPA: hypothetical protein VFZ89_19420 [Solirubrobacteraceae bacterium]